MQELILAQPRGTARTETQRELADAEMHQQFEFLLPECAPLAFRVARAVLRNDADAEDVAQESLLRAYRSFHRLRDRQKFRSWLVRIAFRLALDRLRSAKRRGVREADWLRDSARPANVAAGTRDFQAELDRALAELPEKQRLVLLLSAMEGHSIEEVASLVGIPVGTVKSRLFVAKKHLAEKLRCFVKTTDNR
ncbi:MAG TPA: sigma-70 family RNA polymerase sigma factor [Candidatus Acidoferrum sp.]|nr:sigma-70 family RNA polymerase sigma factor [Candidatus Acidoferrum sp.]